MKFAALLRAAAAEMPEVQDLFACYKTLKKRLKQLPQQGLTRPEPHDGPGPEPEPRRELNPDQERWFVEQVDREVVALNESFIEKEEDNVIRMRSLEDAARAADTSAKLAAIYKEFVDFHGKILLLVHWSILAYTSIVKILKKHHKRTHLLVSAPHLDNLLAQPFCSVEVISEIIRKAEQAIDKVKAQLRIRGDNSATAALSTSSVSPTLDSLSKSILNAAQNSMKAAEAGSHAVSTSSDDSLERRGLPPNGNEAEGPCAAGAARNLAVSGHKRHRWQRTESITSRLQVPCPALEAAAALPVDPTATPCANLSAAAPAGALPLPIDGLGHIGQCLQPDRGASATTAVEEDQAQDGKATESASSEAADEQRAGEALGAARLEGAAAGSTQQPSLIVQGVISNGQKNTPSDVDDVPVARQASNGAAPNSPPARVRAEQLPSILRQTAAALGLWEHIYETASTPSTVLPPHTHESRKRCRMASSLSTDQSVV